MTITVSVPSERGEHELELAVIYYPAEKASWGYDGGDPGHPAYHEVDKAWLLRGKRKKELDVCLLMERPGMDRLVQSTVEEYDA